jgi:hypothetical protein
MTTDFLTLYDSDEAYEIISEDLFGRILAPFSSALLALSYCVEEAAVEMVFRTFNMEFLAQLLNTPRTWST